MRVLMSRRRGAGGGLRIRKRARGFMCGCGGTNAVSISDGSDKQSPMATPQTAASTTPLTLTAASPATTTATTAPSKAARRTTRAGDDDRPAPAAAAAEAPSSLSSSSFYADTTTTDDGPSSMDSTPSLSALLRQLGELERSVRGLHAGAESGGKQIQNGGGGGGGSRRHRRTVSEGCGGGSGRVEESVAVVKESADPLGDFRRSMLQMIVEKEIVGGEELRELLHRFLSLNSPHHHHLILRAFAEIWEEVFAGYERTPDFLTAAARRKDKRPAAMRGGA
ncbi:unnamed protein product [Urochloa humidicola]